MADDLISRHAMISKSYVLYVINHFRSMQTWSEDEKFDEIIRKIKEAPSIEAAPVRRGHWEVEGGMNYYKERICSNCKKHIKSNFWKVCPNCGAKND